MKHSLRSGSSHQKETGLFRSAMHQKRGFTLIELTIVLVVAGLLFVGLWRLLAGGNQQVRDQGAASQQAQLIAAVKGYLASAEGQTSYMANIGAGLSKPLPLPSTAANAAGTAGCATDANMKNAGIPGGTVAGFCTFLPPGSWTSTPNSYGQNFSIRVLKDATAAPAPPTTYSFMIMTVGGDLIPDTSGGRISSLIGSDGGFIYGTNVCNALTGVATNNSACGAYGTWAAAVTATYGFGAGVSGTIASRTSVSPSSDNNFPWLERNTQIPGDPNYVWNTMTTDLYMGGTSRNGTGTNGNFYLVPPVATGNPAGSIYLGGSGGALIGGGALNAQGGSINLISAGVTAPSVPVSIGSFNIQGGILNLNNTGATTSGGVINLQGGTIVGNGFVASGAGLSNNGLGVVAAGVAGELQPMLNILYTGGGHYGSAGETLALTDITTGCTGDSQGGSAAAVAGYVLPWFIDCKPAMQVNGDINITGQMRANDFYSSEFIYRTSDMRLKSDIRPLNDPLDGIMRLKAVSYTLKRNGKSSLGVVAQDVEKVYPQLVIENGGMKSVDYDGLIAPLIGAVQELKKENDQLRQELTIQKTRQQKLEQDMREDESR